MVVGDVVNTASRLQSAAPVNGVLVGRETYAATRSTIAYAAAPPVWRRARPRRSRSGSRCAPQRRRASAGSRMRRSSAGSGTSSSLARLWEQVRDDRRPHLLTVIGPAGIGKSRLAEEFARLVESQGGRALRGRSLPYGDSSAYGAFAQHVKQVAGIFDNDDAARRAREARPRAADGPELTQALALLLGFHADRPIDREGLFFAARAFRRERRARPADDARLRGRPLGRPEPPRPDRGARRADAGRAAPLVALARPELFAERPAWGGGLALVHGALARAARRPRRATQLAVRLLAPREDGDLAAVSPLSAEGNPLFIEELAAAVAERSATELDSLPTTIRSLLAARLDALEPDERSILLDAAVVGKIFWRGPLERLEPRSVGLGASARRARGARTRSGARPSRGSRATQQYSFKHGLMRTVAYATVPRARRRERHAEVARFLEETTTATGESAATLAFHWRAAGDTSVRCRTS